MMAITRYQLAVARVFAPQLAPATRMAMTHKNAHASAMRFSIANISESS